MKKAGHYDLIVVGAGPAGIGASVAAARRGLRVALIESFGFPGGTGTQSCCPIYYGFGVEGKLPTKQAFGIWRIFTVYIRKAI